MRTHQPLLAVAAAAGIVAVTGLGAYAATSGSAAGGPLAADTTSTTTSTATTTATGGGLPIPTGLPTGLPSSSDTSTSTTATSPSSPTTTATTTSPAPTGTTTSSNPFPIPTGLPTGLPTSSTSPTSPAPTSTGTTITPTAAPLPPANLRLKPFVVRHQGKRYTVVVTVKNTDDYSSRGFDTQVKVKGREVALKHQAGLDGKEKRTIRISWTARGSVPEVKVRIDPHDELGQDRSDDKRTEKVR